MKSALIVKMGQSNKQGNAKLLSGVGSDKFQSLRTGMTEPFPGCNNAGQGGSSTPFLVDLLIAQGVMPTVIDATIGGASAFLFCGRQGWALTGNAADPAALGYSSTVTYTGTSTNAVLREGDAGFDPCGLLARTRAMIAAQMASKRFDAVLVLWGQSESDVSYGQAGYYAIWRDALLSIGDYMAASSVDKVLYSLSVQYGATTAVQMQYMQQAIAEAVAARPWAYKGPDLFALWGPNAPLVPEPPPNGATRVHLDLRGQQIYGQKWLDALLAAQAL